MSKFLNQKISKITPYVPGEQPKHREYIKLNTNESPYPPSSLGVEYANEQAKLCYLYSDPECTELTSLVAESLLVKADQVLLTNGSDEILNFAFMAYCDEKTPAVFNDITYGFYKVFAELNGVPSTIIPLKQDFSVNLDEFMKAQGTIFLANPNAPTGLYLSLDIIEKILSSNPNRIVVVDEAYIDFSSQPSYLKVLKEYPNMVVLQTFSKAWGSAGVRLGMAFASEEIIKIFNKVKYPYNVNILTQRYAIKLLDNFSQVEKKVKAILRNREKLQKQLTKVKCIKDVYPTDANFILVKTIDSDAIYKYLIEKGIVARNRNGITLCDNCIRITVGTAEENKQVIAALKNFSK